MTAAVFSDAELAAIADRIVRMNAPVMWSKADLMEFFGYRSVASINKLIAKRGFPKALRLGTPSWDSAAVREWVKKKTAG